MEQPQSRADPVVEEVVEYLFEYGVVVAGDHVMCADDGGKLCVRYEQEKPNCVLDAQHVRLTVADQQGGDPQ
jgi:hypothetical protein